MHACTGRQPPKTGAALPALKSASPALPFAGRPVLAGCIKRFLPTSRRTNLPDSLHMCVVVPLRKLDKDELEPKHWALLQVGSIWVHAALL